MAHILGTVGWLAHCAPGFRDFVLGHLIHAEVPAGKQMTHAGDAEGGMVGLEEGQAWFIAAVGADRTGICYSGHPGAWWGQGPALGMPRMGCGVACSPCRIGILPLPLLRRRLAEVPGDWEALALGFSDLFMLAAGAHADFLMGDHLRRVAATLLRLGGNRHRRFPIVTPESFLCTHEELADAAGLARNAAGRLLRRLRAAGLVEARYGRILLTDVPGLERLADGAWP